MKAIDIVRKIAEEGEYYADNGYGGAFCVHCMKDQGKEPSHDEDCVLVLSRKMIAAGDCRTVETRKEGYYAKIK